MRDLLRHLRRTAQVVLRALLRVAGWLLWPPRWLARQWWCLVAEGGWFRRIAIVLGTAAVAAVVALAATVPWSGYRFAPPFRAVEHAPISDGI